MTAGSIWRRGAAGAATAALPVAILVLVLLMVVPIPALLLDIGFIANIMISLAVLMIALSAARPLDFSSFPTVLLLATLFRLALNVASTRVVLVHGHEGAAAAGHVIEAFGAVLMGGDYVVGLFVFAVLMIINLAVITKGAGRVSEVSARFTLDALPGKQMAIDADLNAGLLSPDEAKARRQEVATEADFYGSMDGASKFVKGDAVAGLLILFVNIIGGLILGVISHGLPVGEAAATYISLAIGDALVAQLPALLLSIAAAAIVTRVASPLDLNGQIGSQMGLSRAWVPVAGILTLIGLVPAMPQLVILPAAALAAGVAWWLSKQEVAAQVPTYAAEEMSSDASLIRWSDICDDAVVALEIGYGLVPLVDERRSAPLMARISGIRRQLSRELGFVLPLVKVSDDLSLPANLYRIRIGGVVVGEDEVRPHDWLALDPGDSLGGITGHPCKDPSFGLDALWVGAEKRFDAIAAGYTVVDPSTVIATHLNRALASNAAELLGFDEAQALVDQLKSSNPQLAQSLTPQPHSLSTILAVSRGLLSERVPLRDFRAIATAMIGGATPDQPPAQLLEAVRLRIGALIVQTIVPSKMPIPAITIEPELENLLGAAVRAAPQADWPFEPALATRLLQAIDQAVEPLTLAARSCAIISSPLCRPPLSRLLRTRFQDIAVLSYLEIPENRQVDIVATVTGAFAGAMPEHSIEQEN